MDLVVGLLIDDLERLDQGDAGPDEGVQKGRRAQGSVVTTISRRA